jgi:diguanylate cyclase (GGDEF)-like protein
MVREDKLSLLLAEFARTLITDFPIQAILNHLADRIVDMLDITAAGVTVISPDSAPYYLAASNGDALAFERLQTELGDGPCRVAYESGEAVQSADLRLEKRFPRFTKAALARGLAASFTFPLRHNDGRLGALDLYRDTAGPLSDSDMVAAQTLADVTAAYILNAQAREEARTVTDRLREIALRDPLTGLPNRLLLQQRLEHAAARAERSHTNAGVLFADLDRFKHINDTYGHQVGDEILIQVARRLSGLVRPGDTLARVSGDEFVFLCEDMAHARDVDVLASRINHSFATPFSAAGHEIVVTASVGMAFAGPGERVSRQLIVDADIAMYQAKRKGGAGHQIIDFREARVASSRRDFESDLHGALDRHELYVEYQPIVRSADGRVIGVEALLRWTHPHRGPVATADIINVAEASGLIVEIGAWVMERACSDREGWRRGYPELPLDIAVNVSARQLLGPGLVRAVKRVLASTGVDASALVLEITEGMFIDDPERAVTVLADLKALGVRIALDDFGTGYCSLNYLHRFPVDIVKIDQCFVHSLGNDDTGTTIIRTIAQLAHALGLTVVAEGVESSSQRSGTIDIGCDAAQGFLYARPMPASKVLALLQGGTEAGLYLPAGSGANTDVLRPSIELGGERSAAGRSSRSARAR